MNCAVGPESFITKTRLLKYTENFTTKKNENFQIKNSDIFHISAQNTDCGYSLEPPRRGGSNEYPQSMFLSRTKESNVYPSKPLFYYIKMGFKGFKIIKACFRDVLSAFWIAKNAQFLYADNEVSDQTARMRRLIWIYVGPTMSRCGSNRIYMQSDMFQLRVVYRNVNGLPLYTVVFNTTGKTSSDWFTDITFSPHQDVKLSMSYDFTRYWSFVIAKPAHDVCTMSHQRRCNVMTMYWRWCDVVSTMCVRW